MRTLLVCLGLLSWPVGARAEVYTELTVSGLSEPELDAADPTHLSRSLSDGDAVAEIAGDLSAGTVRVLTVSNITQASASVTAGDGITVTGPSPTTTLTATLFVDGQLEITGSGTGPAATALCRISFTVGTMQVGTDIGRYYSAMPKQAVVDSTYFNPSPSANPAIQSYGVSPDGSANVTLVVHYPVTIGKSVVIGVSMSSLPTYSPDYMVTTDFGNTARIALSLPPGYSFTSTSGVLLSQAGGAGLPLPPDGGVGVGGMDMAAGGTTAGSTTTGGTTGSGTTGTGTTSAGTTGGQPDGGVTTKKSSGGCEMSGVPDHSLFLLSIALASLFGLLLRRSSRVS